MDVTEVDLAMLARDSSDERVLALVAEVRRWRAIPHGDPAKEDRMLGEVTRDKFNDYEGWTLEVVSGDILVEGHRSDRVRLQMRSPDGKEDANLYVEESDEGNGLVFFIRPVEGHQRLRRGARP